MKYKLKAALLAVAVSACSVLSVSFTDFRHSSFRQRFPGAWCILGRFHFIGYPSEGVAGKDNP